MENLVIDLGAPLITNCDNCDMITEVKDVLVRVSDEPTDMQVERLCESCCVNCAKTPWIWCA